MADMRTGPGVVSTGTGRGERRRDAMRDDDRRNDEDRFTASLAGLAVALFLGIIGLYLLQELARVSKLEDCLLQGRRDCERIEMPRVR
jgi:hypothetical protein